MRKLMLLLLLPAFLGAVSLSLARDANWDGLQKAWKQKQQYQAGQRQWVVGPGIQCGVPKGYQRPYQPYPYDDPRKWEPAP